MATQKLVLKKIDILSVAKLEGLLLAIVGLIIGIVVAIVSVTVGFAASLGSMGAGYGVLAIIIMPIYMGIMGFVAGAIMAFLYNTVAERIGGIKIEFESTKF
jgi:hypothetical protein